MHEQIRTIVKHENKQFRRKKDKSDTKEKGNSNRALGSTYKMLQGKGGAITQVIQDYDHWKQI